MGLKLRMGLAVTGLALSSMFGVNMLAGVKVGRWDFYLVKLKAIFSESQDYVDTTGNIMVDIADGIGMVSKVWFWNWEIGVYCPATGTGTGIGDGFGKWDMGNYRVPQYMESPKAQGLTLYVLVDFFLKR